MSTAVPARLFEAQRTAKEKQALTQIDFDARRGEAAAALSQLPGSPEAAATAAVARRSHASDNQEMIETIPAKFRFFFIVLSASI